MTLWSMTASAPRPFFPHPGYASIQMSKSTAGISPPSRGAERARVVVRTTLWTAQISMIPLTKLASTRTRRRVVLDRMHDVNGEKSIKPEVRDGVRAKTVVANDDEGLSRATGKWPRTDQLRNRLSTARRGRFVSWRRPRLFASTFCEHRPEFVPQFDPDAVPAHDDALLDD